MALPNPQLPADASRPPIGSIVWTVALNAVVPILRTGAACVRDKFLNKTKKVALSYFLG